VGDTTFIYALADPETRRVRYIGKSDDPIRRVRQHARDGGVTNAGKVRWIADLKARSLTPRLMLLEAVDACAWEEAERRWIATARGCGCDLLNMAPGGGYVRTHGHSPETRAKISAALIGHTVPPEVIARIAAKHRGHRWTPEQRARHSASKKGKICGFIGRPPTSETRAKIGAAAKLRGHTEESRRKIAEALSGRKRPPEVAAKQRATWARKRAERVAGVT